MLEAPGCDASGRPVVAVTAANTVASTRIEDSETPRSANDIKPSWCGTAVSSVVNGTTGGAGNELILGGSSGELMFGNGGNDCIHGGDGADTIDGGLLGDDWCKGGPGLDSFLNCEHTIQD
ncbi:MAG TPA: hypothetical protein VM618_00155 [Acidimicrobiia bacterium]|nr:hypothetical protein [Acidimicrobiia bacterium]